MSGGEKQSILKRIDAADRPPRPRAWFPFLPKGVAAFAPAPAVHLWTAQLLMAAFVAAVSLWLLGRHLLPAVRSAIDRLPDQVVMTNQTLHVAGPVPRVLVRTRILALALNPQRQPLPQSEFNADFQVEWRDSDTRVCSILGCWNAPYPAGRVVHARRLEWRSAVEAWKWLGALAWVLVVVIWLMVAWTCMACVLGPCAWLLALYTDRQLSFAGAWRLAGASLMPGAMLLTTALGMYGMGMMPLRQLAVAFPIHLLADVAMPILAVRRLRRASDAPNVPNPFVPPEESSPEREPPDNPFEEPKN
jgi:hypothetical protein